MTNKTLKIVVSNLSTGSIEILDHCNTPDVLVVDAVAMSMNVPFLFQPFSYGGQWYTDGGLYNNFPVTLFPADSVLGLWVKGKHTLPDPFSFQEYAACITMNTMEFYEEQIVKLISPRYQERIITITCPSHTLLEMINADKDTKKKYICIGAESTVGFLFRGFVWGQILLWIRIHLDI